MDQVLGEHNRFVTGDGDVRARVWTSFYWRLGASFAIFVVAVIMTQSVIFTYRLERSSIDEPTRSPNNISIRAAAELGRALEAGQLHDLDLIVAERFGHERSLYVVMRDGRIASASHEALSDAIRVAAEMILRGQDQVDPEKMPHVPGPVVFAPIQANGQLHGLVVMPPPRPRGIVWDAARFLSLPGVVILVVATIVAAFVIFGPARRRLVALETAATRMGGGDWSARAPEDGRDKIARLAKAFNRMGSELASRDEALRTSDRLRRQLLADVSHELRTPLTAMRGFVETLQLSEQELDPERRARYLETVAGETIRLERIVGDLVDLARYESGVGSIDIQVFAIQRVFEHVIRRHERDVDARGISFRLEVSDAADQVVADPNRIEQVVGNLVANAVRFVEKDGTIDLRATAAGDFIELAVVDSGPGIAPEHLANVFDRFYKADPARSSGATGSGLGLSIVKAIVERHGGTIHVSSRPGRTAFVIRLPQPAR